MEVNQLLKITGKSLGKMELIKQFHDTNDIINAVLQQHALNKNDAKRVSKSFDGSNEYTICRKLWEFVHYNLNYKAEPETQTVKTLASILGDAAGLKGNDCKHFSGFEASILDALGIKCFYRFAAYSGKIPTHVYVVALIDNKEIIMDACLPYFDTESKYTYKVDINPTAKKKENMALYRVSGVNTINGKNNALHVAKLIALAPGRLGFLELVKYNVFNLGVKMNEAIMKDRPAVEDFWWNLGGKDFGQLLANAIEGKTKNRIFGLAGIDQNNTQLSPDCKIGFDPATATAAIASATAIIVEVKKLFSQLNIPHNDVYQNAPYQDAQGNYNYNQQAPTDTTKYLLYAGVAFIAYKFLLK